MNNKRIWNTAARVFKPKPASFDKRIMHPVREWLIGLSVFLAIILIGGTQSALLFVQYKNIDTHGGTYSEPLPRYNDVLVNTVLQRYRERTANYEAYQSTFSVEPTLEMPIPTTASTTEETVTTPTEDQDTSEEVSEEEESIDDGGVIQAI